METLAGFSLAANVVQFIDFSCTLVSRGKDFHRNGSLTEHSDLENVTRSLVHYNRRLRESLESKQSSTDERTEDEKVRICEAEPATAYICGRFLSRSRQIAHKSLSSFFNESSN